MAPCSMKTGTSEDEIQRDYRTYRAEKTYAVSEGKWYFEFELVSDGPMRVGWARVDCKPGSQLGSDEYSWAFDGFNTEKIHQNYRESYGQGRNLRIGDVIGCFLDVTNKSMSEYYRP
ncbi:unnamed protein product [Allacma fusca]|uniref:B30.2/SPRY domain-containing protein n=1 Tax=Allacma fusca TaxID=39272 RepID=A0A8J2JZG0_9HEXA|nr:unnamed protein product [Allacma fusca]